MIFSRGQPPPAAFAAAGFEAEGRRMQTRMSDTQKRLFELLENYPRFDGLWNQEAREYDASAVGNTLATCSRGEVVILKCILTIWGGNAGSDGEFMIDIAGLATLDKENRRPLVQWLAAPFWP